MLVFWGTLRHHTHVQRYVDSQKPLTLAVCTTMAQGVKSLHMRRVGDFFFSRLFIHVAKWEICSVIFWILVTGHHLILIMELYVIEFLSEVKIHVRLCTFLLVGANSLG